MPEIVPLSSDHDRSGFDCGVPELNAFLKATARQHIEKGISRTFVLIDQESPASIMGFFTITLCEVRAEKLPDTYARKYPKHPLPALRLARLAVSLKFKGKGYGGLLLAEAIHRTVLVAEQAGLIGLFVDAKDQNAYTFYERYGFVPIPDSPLELFLPLATFLKALQKSVPDPKAPEFSEECRRQSLLIANDPEEASDLEMLAEIADWSDETG